MRDVGMGSVLPPPSLSLEYHKTIREEAAAAARTWNERYVKEVERVRKMTGRREVERNEDVSPFMHTGVSPCGAYPHPLKPSFLLLLLLLLLGWRWGSLHLTLNLSRIITQSLELRGEAERGRDEKKLCVYVFERRKEWIILCRAPAAALTVLIYDSMRVFIPKSNSVVIRKIEVLKVSLLLLSLFFSYCVPIEINDAVTTYYFVRSAQGNKT